MATGYEVEAYQNLARVARALREISATLLEIRDLLRAGRTGGPLPPIDRATGRAANYRKADGTED